MTFWNSKKEKGSAAELIAEFLAASGQSDFTYEDLRRWYYGSGAYKRYQRDWHTVERMVRKLSEEGHLLRYRWKRTMRYVPVPRDFRIDAYLEAFHYARTHADVKGMLVIAERLAGDLGIEPHVAHNLLANIVR